MDRPLRATHRAIYDDLRARVLRGDLRAGDRVPASRELAEQLGVARMTVVRAYGRLLEEGYLVSRAGAGTFVAATVPDRLLSVGRRAAPQPVRPVASAPAPTSELGAFAPNTPALDLFPYALWARLAGRAARGLHGAELAYADPRGFAPLREAIARHWRTTRGARIDASRIVITAGAQNAFHVLGRALARPGDLAAVETPGYPYAHRAFRQAGLQLAGLPVDAEGLVVEALARLPRPPRLIYVTPAHQQPTGAALSMPRRLALLDYARRHDCYIVEDDYDSEFRYTGRPLPVLQSLDGHGRVVLVSSFSKTLFPALRLGFACAPGEAHVEAFAREQDEVARSVSALDQRVLSLFMDEGHYARHLRAMRRHYAQRRDHLKMLLEGPPGRRIRDAVDLQWPHTGFCAVAWLREKRPDFDALGPAAAARGLQLVPFRTKQPARQALLLGFGNTPPARMAQAVAALASLLG